MLVCLDLRTGTGCGFENNDTALRCQRCGKSLRFALQLHDPGVLLGQYRIVNIIGHGGFGAVYEARVDRRPDVQIAIKETFDPNSIHSFANEFGALHHLRHPNLPRYYEIFEHQGNGYLVMEFVPGQSLDDVLKSQQGPLPESQVLGYAVQICDVLSYLHTQTPAITHRDIKPANIRITPSGLIKLVDFGMLKRGDEATRSSRRGLTPAYAPPEQWGGNGSTTPRSDIYSFGATLYHLLTGQKALSATERIIANPDPLVPPHEINPSISAPVSATVVRAMALIHQERFSEPQVMKQALMGMVVAPPPPPPPPPVVETPPAPQTPRTTAQMDVPETIHILRAHTSFIWCVAWSADGEMLASGGSDQTIRLWNAATGDLLRTITLDGFMNNVNCLAFSPDGASLACGSNDTTVSLWHVADGSLISYIGGHGGPVMSVDWSADGEVIASGSSDSAARIWSVEDGSLVHTLHGHTQGLLSVAFSPDGSLLASGGGGNIVLDSNIRIWRVRDGRLLRTLTGHTGTINSLAFSSNGQTLASGSGDRTARLWRVADGTALHVLTSSDLASSVSSVSFSPDGTVLAGGTWDTTIWFWRVDDGAVLHKLNAHDDWIKGVVFRPDGTMLASAGDDQTVRLWRVT